MQDREFECEVRHIFYSYNKKNMEQDNKVRDTGNTGHEHPLPGEISQKDKELAESSHKEADKDMEEDADLTSGSPNDDLDEGELARLGEDNDLI